MKTKPQLHSNNNNLACPNDKPYKFAIYINSVELKTFQTIQSLKPFDVKNFNHKIRCNKIETAMRNIFVA